MQQAPGTQCNAQPFSVCAPPESGFDLSDSSSGVMGRSISLRPGFDDGSEAEADLMPIIACGTIKPTLINPEIDMLPAMATADGTALVPGSVPCVE